MILAILSSLAIPFAIALALWTLLHMVSWMIRSVTRVAVALAILLGLLFLATAGEPGSVDPWVDGARRAVAGGIEALTTAVRLAQAVLTSPPVL